MAYSLLVSTDFTDTSIRERNRKTVTITNGATSTPVLIGDNAKAVTVALTVSGSSGKVQASISSLAAIDGGTANWFDWDAGVVSASTIETWYGPVQAIRGVSSSGTITMEVMV